MSKRLLSVGAIVGAGALLAVPVAAAAQDDDGRLSDVLSELVQDGTLTEEQAAAVADALEEARPNRVFDHEEHDHGPGPWEHGRSAGGWFLRGSLEAVADTIGIELEELTDLVREGQTIAEIAEANGVEPQQVIDALVAEAQARLDRLVEDGRLEESEVAERLAEATERITELVNEGVPFLRHHHGPDGPDGD